jgi:hypothetical protein
VFAGLLLDDDARRATETVEALLAHGLHSGLTGGLAISAQLRAHGRQVERGHINDIDLVVQDFDAIPESVAGSFLLHHVHPDAAEGKLLLQLIDETTAVRVDLFRAFGNTLARASALDGDTGPLEVLCVEDLVARTTALVCGSLRRGTTVDPKHARALSRLLGLGRQEQLAAAWNDHRQAVTGTLDEATSDALRLLADRQNLMVAEEYSAAVTPCDRCGERGPFRPGGADRVVEVLGYW